MSIKAADTALDSILFGAIELSKATWLVALQTTDLGSRACTTSRAAMPTR
jgi:hypothetical protein